MSAIIFVAQAVVPIFNTGNVYAAGPPSGCKTNSNSLLDVTDLGIPTYGCGSDTSIVETILKLVFGALAMFSLLFVVIGGLKYTLSGGDSNAIASAKQTILYAVIGLVLGVSVFTLVSYIFGVLT